MALPLKHQTSSTPLSVEEIVSAAQDFEFSTNRALKNWLRSAQMLLTEASICEEDGNLQKAYLYLYRHAELVLAKLPQHPDFKDPKFKADLLQAQKTVQKNLTKLEQWKPRIQQERQRFLMAMGRRNLERRRIQGERAGEARQSLGDSAVRRDSIEFGDGAPDDSEHSINAMDNRQLAVDLANQELQRRDASRRATTQAGIPQQTVAARRRGLVVNDRDQVTREPYDDRGVSHGVQEAARYLHQQDTSRSSQPTSQNAASASYQYPSVPTKESAMHWETTISPSRPSAYNNQPPSVPGKEELDWPLPRTPLPPRIPSKPHNPASSAQPLTKTLTHQLPPKYTFKPTATTESGSPLRPVFLPSSLRQTFLNLAHPNTTLNLETCGILCGTIISPALFINHLIIPDQTSTSDTCDTTEEGDNALFDYCDTHSLLVCGWIHTHPSQSCFLSSRDLHTSSGYQVMLPEAIAIVCAPRQNPDWGVFRLTDPPGLQHVLNCRQKGLFHPHEERDLYTDAVKPGHVVEGPGLPFEVVDLRQSWV